MNLQNNKGWTAGSTRKGKSQKETGLKMDLDRKIYFCRLKIIKNAIHFIKIFLGDNRIFSSRM